MMRGTSCIRCGTVLAPFRRGLCDRCYRWAFGNDVLDEVALPSKRPVDHHPHRRWCPTCPGGGMVTTYRADAEGRAESLICLGPDHIGRRLLPLAVRDAMLGVA